ncbi:MULTISPECIES: uroporphyrinogen-III synthase [unclassified Lysinibacillus]|uniref:uroporphyrinogen-III synthase n=1 Tax=unclassified Lysinibacillus TaxID=2636778 RepID=UPI002553E0CF|nr:MULTISPECIES: uroporphyrinogen-III synthase [unclassified Lysinibacillus]MDM5249529.1 uroporphyrinogen-III synthase [Lysinibacillus sp. G4S2]
MQNNLPLEGKTIILTGTSKTTTIIDDITALGGQAIITPLIETCELIDKNDDVHLELARQFEWLIFTSQNAVDAFASKMKRFNLSTENFQVKIASIGTKTTTALEKLGFHVSFMPSIFSADVFVKEFPNVAGSNPTCLFIRGEKAKKTLKEGLPFNLKEWTVYETIERHDQIQVIIDCIRTNSDVTVIFASPSAVDVYAMDVASVIGWKAARVAAIGHITEAAILNHGATVDVMPSVYTMQAVFEEITKVGE